MPYAMLRHHRNRRVFAAAGALAATLLAGSEAAQAQAIPLIRDTEIENLLNDYAQPIFKAAGLGGGRVAIRIVRSDTYNAFVLDGRNVFIHTGTLTQSTTPNQVIGVIAHEAGHISGGHMAALRARIARDQTRMLLVRILGIGAAIASGRGEAVAAGDELVLRSLLAERRSQEAAADQAGLAFLNATRQSGRGMLETFERFADQELFSERNMDAFVRSHPVAVDRLAQLRNKVQGSPYYAVKDPPDLQLRHDMMRAKLAGYLDRPPTVFNRYPQTDLSLPARYARAIARFFSGGPSALQAALADVDGLIRDKPNDPHITPYLWELKGDFLKRSGRSADAVAPLRQALKLSNDASLIRLQLAQALFRPEEAADLNEVVALLRKVLVEDPNPDAFRLLATAYYKQNKLAEADAASAQAEFMRGDITQAQNFAKRAQRQLRPGTPEWIKMDDIINYKPQT